jgi:hypothetical protein
MRCVILGVQNRGQLGQRGFVPVSPPCPSLSDEVPHACPRLGDHRRNSAKTVSCLRKSRSRPGQPALASSPPGWPRPRCPGYAQAPWPTWPIRIVLPLGTGGGSDITTRLLAPTLAEILAQPMFLENRRPGAGDLVGTDDVVWQPANRAVLNFPPPPHS